jgi:hypothetical protein
MVRLFLIGTAMILAISINNAPAAELAVTTKHSTVRAHRHLVVHKQHRHFGIWKTVGYPCLLPPHVIVQSNWNGPQCRYVDNIILP